jgi:hypothetical protein
MPVALVAAEFGVPSASPNSSFEKMVLALVPGGGRSGDGVRSVAVPLVVHRSEGDGVLKGESWLFWPSSGLSRKQVCMGSGDQVSWQLLTAAIVSAFPCRSVSHSGAAVRADAAAISTKSSSSPSTPCIFVSARVNPSHTR